jgi:hypothetical protein
MAHQSCFPGSDLSGDDRETRLVDNTGSSDLAGWRTAFCSARNTSHTFSRRLSVNMIAQDKAYARNRSLMTLSVCKRRIPLHRR